MGQFGQSPPYICYLEKREIEMAHRLSGDLDTQLDEGTNNQPLEAISLPNDFLHVVFRKQQ